MHISQITSTNSSYPRTCSENLTENDINNVICCSSLSGAGGGTAAGIFSGRAVASIGWSDSAICCCGATTGIGVFIVGTTCLFSGGIVAMKACKKLLNRPVEENSYFIPATGTTNSNPIEIQPRHADQRVTAIRAQQPGRNAPLPTYQAIFGIEPNHEEPPPSYDDAIGNGIPQAAQGRIALHCHTKNTDPDRLQKTISAGINRQNESNPRSFTISSPQNSSNNTASIQINTPRKNENISFNFNE